MNGLSHTNEHGRARMVDIGDKPAQRRTAAATGRIRLARKTVGLIADNNVKKGDVLAVAEFAGIQAAKRTAELVPLCHPLSLTNAAVKAALDDEGVVVTSRVSCVDRTGVEMEALTAVAVALLTVYDMCKAVDKTMTIENVRLVEKTKR